MSWLCRVCKTPYTHRKGQYGNTCVACHLRVGLRYARDPKRRSFRGNHLQSWIDVQRDRVRYRLYQHGLGHGYAWVGGNEKLLDKHLEVVLSR